MASILIATPCYGKLMGEGFVHSLVASIDLLRSKGHQVKLYTLGNESLITRARNNMTAYFLSSSFDRLMFIDADISWQPQALLDLIESDHDVCGIPYPTKFRDWEKLMRFMEKKLKDGVSVKPSEVMNSSLRFTVNPTDQKDKPVDGWQKVKALGTGFLMIKRNVLETMRDHYREDLTYKNDIKGYAKIDEKNCVGLFETLIDPKTKRYLSEDYAFCQRWLDIGGSIYACLKYRLTHTGTADF